MTHRSLRDQVLDNQVSGLTLAWQLASISDGGHRDAEWGDGGAPENHLHQTAQARQGELGPPLWPREAPDPATVAPLPLPPPVLVPPQLPQCLCIHLQRLSWSSQGAPLKRHEHVQFNEFLMMDIYKYRLLGHKPHPCGPKPGEELQGGPMAPKSGGCPRP